MSPRGSASTKTLESLFEDELADVYDAEKRLVKALPKMAKAATDESLRQAISEHLAQTERHVEKVESIFESIGKTARGKKCDAMVGILVEGDAIAADFRGSPAINAAIISAAQKVEHYEIASYGCLSEWAGLLENSQAQELLEEILAEEKQADETLTECARNGMNEEGMEAEDAEDEPAKAARPARKQSTAASRGRTASRARSGAASGSQRRKSR